MNQCKKCGNQNYSTIVIHTETTFGHGDSSHKCYVKCHQCNNTTQEVWGMGLFESVTLRQAQSLWNNQNQD